MASISRTLISTSNYLSSFTEISRAVPISHLDGGGITYFTPDHDSGISPATQSHILLCIEFTEGMFTSFLLRDVCKREKINRHSTFISSTSYVVALNFSNFCVP